MTTDDAPQAQSPAGYEIVSALRPQLGIQQYKAVQTALGRPVVLHVLTAEAANRPTCAASFSRQRRVCAALRHENVVGAIEAGTFEGGEYFVTEHVDGATLADYLAANRPSPDVRPAMKTGLDIARALVHFESLKLVHREITPRSIVLSETGTARIVDFRRAKFLAPDAAETWQDVSINVALYAAPEVALGGPGIDIRADIYSFGCVLYYLVTGRPPFYGRNVGVVLDWQRKRLPRDPRWLRPDLPRAVADVLEACLRKLPQERYPTATALCADMEALLAGRAPSPPRAANRGWERPFEKHS